MSVAVCQSDCVYNVVSCLCPRLKEWLLAHELGDPSSLAWHLCHVISIHVAWTTNITYRLPLVFVFSIFNLISLLIGWTYWMGNTYTWFKIQMWKTSMHWKSPSHLCPLATSLPPGGHLQVLLELSPDAERWVSTHTYLDDGKVWPKQVFRLAAFGVLCYVMDLKQGLFYPLKVQDRDQSS